MIYCHYFKKKSMFQTATGAVSCTDGKLGTDCRWLTWLLWMEMAQASLRGSCWRLRWIPPPDLNTQRSGFSTSVTPHRKRTRGCPGVDKQRTESLPTEKINKIKLNLFSGTDEPVCQTKDAAKISHIQQRD